MFGSNTWVFLASNVGWPWPVYSHWNYHVTSRRPPPPDIHWTIVGQYDEQQQLSSMNVGRSSDQRTHFDDHNRWAAAGHSPHTPSIRSMWFPPEGADAFLAWWWPTVHTRRMYQSEWQQLLKAKAGACPWKAPWHRLPRRPANTTTRAVGQTRVFSARYPFSPVKCQKKAWGTIFNSLRTISSIYPGE